MVDKRQEFLNKVYEDSFEYERKYGFCSQAVLASLQDNFDFIDDIVIKALQSLAGGGALCGDGSCGGLAGGMTAISCKFGRSRDDFGNSKFNSRLSSSLSRKLRERFIEEFGSVICEDVQTKKMGRGFDLWDKEDYRKFEEAGAHTEHCPDVTGKVASWTAEILLDEGVSPE